MRFGMQIPYLIGIFRRFREHRTNPVKMIFFQTMADIFFMLYLTTDHPQFFVNIGFMQKSDAWKERMGWLTEFWWFLQTVCEILCHIVHI